MVDTGATMLALPKHVALEVGLTPTCVYAGRHADGRVATKPIATGIRIEIQGQQAAVDAVIKENGFTSSHWAYSIATLDLQVDPEVGILQPRPESPDIPMIDLLIQREVDACSVRKHSMLRGQERWAE